MTGDVVDGAGGSRGVLLAELFVAVLGLALVLAELVVLSGSLAQRPPAAGSAAAVLPLPAPPDLPASGSWSEGRVLASGEIAVTMWIRNEVPITRLTLAVPHVAGLPPGVRATGVVVGSGGRVVARSGPVGTRPVVVRLPEPTTLAYVGYRLVGAPVSAGGSARLTSLDVRYRPRVGPAEVFLSGAGVTKLLCTPADSPTVSLPCGQVRDGRWGVVLKAADRRDRVSALLDLP